MKTFFFTLVLSCFAVLGLSAQATDHRAIISDSLEVYLQANYDKDYDKIMDMVYPRLFDIVAREDMIAMFQGMASEGIEFEISNGVIDSISKVIVQGGERFARVDYRMDMMMRFTGIEYEGESTQDLIYTSFQGQYGAENVRRKDGAFYVNADKIMIAIASVDTPNWTFMEMNKEQPKLLEMLLPVEVIEAFAK